MVWIPDIPLRKGLGFLGVPRFENAPNHPFTSIHHSLNPDSFVRKYFEGKPRSFAVNLVKAVKFDPLKDGVLFCSKLIDMVCVFSFGKCSYKL